MKIQNAPYNKKLNSSTRKFLSLAALGTVIAAQNASAILTWDLRAVSVTTGGLVTPVADPKNVTISPDAALVQTDVTFELWAVVTGSDGIINETMTSGQGTILSGPGTLSNRSLTVAGNLALAGQGASVKGDLTNLLVAPWATATTARSGLSVDLDGDGDLDVGSNSNGPSANYIQANAGGAQTGAGLDPSNFRQLANGREFKISIATFRITGLTLGASSTGAVNYVAPDFTSSLTDNARASFATDGVTRSGADAQLAVAAPVLIQVPEPSAFGMVLLGAMGVIGFRRLGIRRA